LARTTKVGFTSFKPVPEVDEYLHGTREPGKSKWSRRILWLLRSPVFFDNGATLSEMEDILGYSRANLSTPRKDLIRFKLITRSGDNHLLTPEGIDYIDSVAQFFHLETKISEWEAMWEEALKKQRTDVAEFQRTKDLLIQEMKEFLKYFI
jgi:hypothetical protein